MSRLKDLRKYIGQTIYFSRTMQALQGEVTTVRQGILIDVGEYEPVPMCIVEWNECLCLDEHGSDVLCHFGIREAISIFLVQTTPPVEIAS